MNLMQLFIQLCSADSLSVFTGAVYLEAKDYDVMVEKKMYSHRPQAIITFHSCD
jgi:hypothetical protein